MYTLVAPFVLPLFRRNFGDILTTRLIAFHVVNKVNKEFYLEYMQSHQKCQLCFSQHLEMTKTRLQVVTYRTVDQCHDDEIRYDDAA